MQNNKTKLEQSEDFGLISNQQLGFFTRQEVKTVLTIPIDEEVKQASYYRQVVQAINNLAAEDEINLEINSYGGNINGLVALLSALKRTEALSTAFINGEAHSAASFLALSCDNIVVSPHATMLVHFASAGSAGKVADMRKHVQHVHDTTEQLFRDTYQGFLSEEEIERCVEGNELWLNADEIIARLEQKFAAQQANEEDEHPNLDYQSCDSCNAETCYGCTTNYTCKGCSD